VCGYWSIQALEVGTIEDTNDFLCQGKLNQTPSFVVAGGKLVLTDMFVVHIGYLPRPASFRLIFNTILTSDSCSNKLLFHCCSRICQLLEYVKNRMNS